MLFAGKLKMVCLLVGLLTISEIGAQTAESGGTVFGAEARQEAQMQEADAIEVDENEMQKEYERLEAEEKELKEQLQEKESALDSKDEAGQVEVMDLQEAVRRVQLQMIVLKARMEETF